MSQQQAEHYRRQQEAKEREEMLEKSKHHPLINGLLKHVFGSSKS